MGDGREQARWARARLGRCGPALDLLTARFARHEYAPHAHDEYTVGVTVGGLEVIAYRGGRIVSGPGSIVVLEPGEMHTGGPAAPEGYAYQALYAAPALLGDGTLGTALPYFPDPVLHDPDLAAALRRTHTGLSAHPDPLEAESRLPWLKGLARNLRAHWKPMLAFAVIEIVGPWYALTDAERHLSSSTAGLLIAGVPIVGVLLSRRVRRLPGADQGGGPDPRLRDHVRQSGDRGGGRRASSTRP